MINQIDFEITSSDGLCSASIRVAYGTPRSRMFYFYRLDDTREDGECRLSVEMYKELSEGIEQLIRENDNLQPYTGDITYRLWLDEKKRLGFTKETLLKLLELFAETVPDLQFMGYFAQML